MLMVLTLICKNIHVDRKEKCVELCRGVKNTNAGALSALKGRSHRFRRSVDGKTKDF